MLLVCNRLTTTGYSSVSLASENVRFFKQVKCPVCLRNRNHPVVVVVAVGKCESRVVCGICKRGGKVVFLTFPPCVFSPALTCFLVSGVKSFPCALWCPTRCPAIVRVRVASRC